MLQKTWDAILKIQSTGVLLIADVMGKGSLMLIVSVADGGQGDNKKYAFTDSLVCALLRDLLFIVM